MSCPACGGSVPGGQERCPACGAHVAPLTEGALAPDPSARPRPEPLREIPGLKKRERTWKDEVRERVRDRKRQRGGGGELPLFRDAGEGEDTDAQDSSMEDTTLETASPADAGRDSFSSEPESQNAPFVTWWVATMRLRPAPRRTSIAHAPSDAGHDSNRRTGSHTIGESRTISSEMSSSFKCAYGFFSAFLRSFTATIQPTYSGAFERSM